MIILPRGLGILADKIYSEGVTAGCESTFTHPDFNAFADQIIKETWLSAIYYDWVVIAVRCGNIYLSCATTHRLPSLVDWEAVPHTGTDQKNKETPFSASAAYIVVMRNRVCPNIQFAI